MNIEDLSMKFVKYRWTRFDITIPGMDDYTVDPTMIGDFYIEKGYEEYYLPYIEITLMVPKDIKQAMLKHHEEIYVYAKLEYAQFEDLYETNPDNVLYMYGTIFDQRFYALMEDETPKLTEGSPSDDAEDARETNTADLLLAPIQMALYVPEHYFNTNQIINAVLGGASPLDGIMYILNKIKVRKALVSPAQRNTKMNQLILTPLPVFQQLDRLCNEYHIHDAGSTIFFDYDCIYILDKKLDCTAWAPNEYRKTHLVSFGFTRDGSQMKTGFYSNSQEMYSAINITGNNLSITGTSVVNDQIAGGNAVIIDGNTGEVTTVNSKRGVSTSAVDKVNRILVSNTGDDPSKVIDSGFTQANRVMDLVCSAVNIRALSPNKDFIFTTDNPDYNKYCGHYRIISMTASFAKDGLMYTPFVQCRFVGGT